MPPLTLAGRAAPGGPVDDLTLQSGHWATRPGQLVLASSPARGCQLEPPLGQKITVTGVPGKPTLTIVGLASSVTSTAGGWVTPGEIARLRAHGHAGHRADAVPVPQRGHRRRRPRRRARGQRRAARRGDHRHAVLPGRQGPGDVGDRAVRAVPGRVRGHRPGHVGADRGQRGQRRGGVRLPADRHPQEHRLHPRPGGGRATRARSRCRPSPGAWSAWCSGTCWPCRCWRRPPTRSGSAP